MAIPRTVGKYEIVDAVGAGGMGTVYRAFDPTLERMVALKIVHLDRVHDVPFERSEEHTSELQSRGHLVCRLLLEKKKKTVIHHEGEIHPSRQLNEFFGLVCIGSKRLLYE